MDEKQQISDIYIEAKDELPKKVSITKTGKVRKPYPRRPSLVTMRQQLQQLEAKLEEERETRKALENSGRGLATRAPNKGIVFL